MSYTIINPATGDEMETIEHATVEQTDDAIERARVAQKEWAGFTPAERAEALRRFARTVEADVETLAALEDAIENFAGCAVVISHDRFFLDRLATHILAFEGDSKVVWFEGNYQDYEADRHRRLGTDADQPHRIMATLLDIAKGVTLSSSFPHFFVTHHHYIEHAHIFVRELILTQLT